MFSKPKKHITILLVLMMAVFSIGMTTMVLKVAHAQEQKFTALLGGNQEINYRKREYYYCPQLLSLKLKCPI